MKQPFTSLLLASWWLAPSDAFNFEHLDTSNLLSPAFNLKLAANPNDSGFELQQEPSAQFGSSEQPGSGFTSYLSRDSISLWDEGEGALLERQVRTCPAGTYMCASGGCCYTGTTCVGNNKCCPSGNQQCGSSGCYNPSAGESCCGASGRYCERGYDCVANGCCRTGKKPCGSIGCYDPKTEVCCSATSTTCSITQECVPGGCCPKGMKRCGASKCYDPNTETCCPASSGLCGRQTGVCALDTICPRDKSCVAGNACCPKGHKICGTDGCYDPVTETCCQDTGEHCLKDYDCVEGGCCPKGMIPCGKNGSKCYDPKTSVCCQDKVGTSNWACKSGYQCCAASGGCFDAKTQRCCPFGPCDIDGACCGTQCCPAGYLCNKNKKCQKKRQPKPPKTTSCTTPTPAATRGPRPMQTINFVYDPNRKIKNHAGDSITLSNHAVLMNMCRGMKKMNGGKDTQTATLTHGGKCWQERNRAIMCPKKFCANAISEYVRQFFPNGIPAWAREAIRSAGDLQCDEYPFASSLQGGDLVNGVTVCLPGDDNSFQGYTMSKYFRNKKGGADIVEGEDYMINIDGWNCATQAPTRRSVGEDVFGEAGLVSGDGLKKRDAFDDSIERHGEEMYHGFDKENSKLNLMTMPLGDLTAGTYIINLNVSRGNLSYAVVDHLGNSFDATVLSDRSVQFTLDENWEAVAVVGTTEEQDVELIYRADILPDDELEVPTTSSTVASAPTPSATNKNAGNVVRIDGTAWASLVICAVIVGLVF